MFSNLTTVGFIGVWILFGIAMHYFHYRTTHKSAVARLDDHSRVAAADLEAAHDRAKANGVKLQLDLLVAKARQRGIKTESPSDVAM